MTGLSRAPRFVIFSFVPFFLIQSREGDLTVTNHHREKRSKKTITNWTRPVVLKQLIDSWYRTGVEKETEYISSETLQKEKFQEKCPKLNLKVILIAKVDSKLVISSRKWPFRSQPLAFFDFKGTIFDCNKANDSKTGIFPITRTIFERSKS